MHPILWLCVGLLVGVYAPRAVAWAMTMEERHREARTGPRVSVDDLLHDEEEELDQLDDDPAPAPLRRRDLRARRRPDA